MRIRSGTVFTLLLVFPLLSGCRSGSIWSPDGKQIALDPYGQLFTLDVATRKFQARSKGPLKVMSPNWSVDGRRLVYYQAGVKGGDVTSLSLMQQELATGKQTPLIAKLDMSKPPQKEDEFRINLNNTEDLVRMMAVAAWSPDDKQLVYGAPEGEDVGIWVASANGSGARRLLPKGRHGIDASWSADSRAVAYFGMPPTGMDRANPEGDAAPQGPKSPDLDVINADGTGHRILWDSKQRGSIAPFGPAPRWSSDNKTIYILIEGEKKPGTERADTAVLWSVPVDGSEPQRVADVPGPSPFVTLTPHATALTLFFAPKSEMETAPTLGWGTAPFAEMRPLHLLDAKATGQPAGGEVDRFPIPEISPDGKQIAVMMAPKVGKCTLMIASSAGGPLQKLTIPVATAAPAKPVAKPAAKKPAPKAKPKPKR